jgi:hypothetical protein
MVDGKMVVLKPVVWNDNGYHWPAGRIATSGYTEQYGYGHEEWNGRDDWIWEGWKVFHTEAKGKMHYYAESGRLGIIMTAMNEGKFYAVGVGCNVFENNKRDAASIARELNLPDYVDRMWEVGSIKKALQTRKALEQHWIGHTHVNWRCPQTHFAWFADPILIIPNDLIPEEPPRQAIAKMHGSYQTARPDQALSIVRKALPSHHSVINWLSTDDFDPIKNRMIRNAPKPRGDGKSSASTPTDNFRRYLQENEIVVTPLHHKLQNDFQAYLKQLVMKDIEADIECVDLRYSDPKIGSVFVEVKPTERSTVRFAIRTAMGQLLDYQQRATGSPKLLIVIDDKPAPEETSLALSNGFAVAWRNGGLFDFVWPSETT